MKFMRKLSILALIVSLSLSTVACTSKEITTNTTTNSPSTAESAITSVESKEINSFENYIKLIGLTKKDLISTVGEQPKKIDEGGLEFPKAGIRVWFKDYGSGPVQQVYTDKKDVEFNGVKIGDKISSFKNIFGTPVKEDTNSAFSNFNYKGIVLSVYYDPKTEITFAAYILDQEVK